MARPIRRNQRGTYDIAIDPSALDLVGHLCDEIEQLLTTDSPLLARLFPPPYGDDKERNDGYAALAVPELIERRQECIATVRESLGADELSEDQLMAWMRAINDMRLVLGTLLGVTDDGDPPVVPDDMVDTAQVYEFLGGLLEVTVDALAS